jgi:hypothetical protein
MTLKCCPIVEIRDYKYKKKTIKNNKKSLENNIYENYVAKIHLLNQEIETFCLAWNVHVYFLMLRKNDVHK